MAVSQPARTFVERFLEHLRVERNLSPHSLRAYEGDVREFLRHLRVEDEAAFDPDAVSRDDVAREVCGGACVRVRGKGRKERIAPLGRAALEAIEAYLAHERPRLERPGEGALFLNKHGDRLGVRGVRRLVVRYAARAGI